MSEGQAMTDSTMRQEFEKWARETLDPPQVAFATHNGTYIDDEMESRWTAWTASRKQALEDVRQLIKSKRGEIEDMPSLAADMLVSAIRAMKE